MNALWGLAIVATIIKGIYYDSRWLITYLVLIVLYTAFTIKMKNPKENTKRKTLMISTWNGKSFHKQFKPQFRTF